MQATDTTSSFGATKSGPQKTCMLMGMCHDVIMGNK